MFPTNVLPFPDIQHTRHYGACPDCGKSDGFVNLGIEHWFICREHKNKWLAGTNLFDDWMNQTVAQSQSAEILLRSYLDVLPVRSTQQEFAVKKRQLL
ncbi:MAG: hypothetical protein ACI9SC_000777 [Gammaproteobacteria bacterium]|jgi:hypothetical protein